MSVRKNQKTKVKNMTKTIVDLFLGVMLLNGAILTSFLSYQCWEDFRERRAKNQKQTNSKVNGL
jgi:TctA family transporter